MPSVIFEDNFNGAGTLGGGYVTDSGATYGDLVWSAAFLAANPEFGTINGSDKFTRGAGGIKPNAVMAGNPGRLAATFANVDAPGNNLAVEATINFDLLSEFRVWVDPAPLDSEYEFGQSIMLKFNFDGATVQTPSDGQFIEFAPVLAGVHTVILSAINGTFTASVDGAEVGNIGYMGVGQAGKLAMLLNQLVFANPAVLYLKATTYDFPVATPMGPGYSGSQGNDPQWAKKFPNLMNHRWKY